MSKKLGLENKYKQFIKPTQLGQYKAVMGKIKTESGKLKDLRSSTFASGFSKAYKQANIKQAASSVLKRSPIGKIVTGIGKAFMSKPGMFGAGVGIGSNIKKDNKKMGGGMMRYKTGNAVKLSPKQKVIAAKAPPMNRIDGKDFAVLKAEKAKGRGQGLQDEKMKPGKIMKADKGVFAEKLKKANRRPRTLLDRDLPLKTERLRGMTPEKLNKMLEEYNKKNSNKPDFKPKFLKKMGGGMMKADKGIAVDFNEKRKTTYNVKDVYKLANENKTGARPTSEDVRQAAKFLKVKLNPKTR